MEPSSLVDVPVARKPDLPHTKQLYDRAGHFRSSSSDRFLVDDAVQGSSALMPAPAVCRFHETGISLMIAWQEDVI